MGTYRNIGAKRMISGCQRLAPLCQALSEFWRKFFLQNSGEKKQLYIFVHVNCVLETVDVSMLFFFQVLGWVYFLSWREEYFANCGAMVKQKDRRNNIYAEVNAVETTKTSDVLFNLYLIFFHKFFHFFVVFYLRSITCIWVL